MARFLPSSFRAVGHVDAKRLKRPSLVHLSQLFDGHVR
jgi:hypothetical protein